MVRSSFSVLSLVVVGACIAPANQTPNAASGPSAPTEVAAPVTLPMDPGQVSCAQVNSNSGFAVAGAPWVNGQLRANLMRNGAASASASDAETAAALISFCAANPTATLRSAIASLSAG